MSIRPERAADHAAVHALVSAAFEQPAEADLVAALREQASPIISLVCVEGDEVLGHILFSPVSLDGHPDLKVMGLAPMAVTPRRQNGGIGAQLVRAGLDACRELGVAACVVLGHPQYYPRFGFRPSVEFGIDSVYTVPPEVFMAQELLPGVLAGRSGRAHYHPAFAGV